MAKELGFDARDN